MAAWIVPRCPVPLRRLAIVPHALQAARIALGGAHVGIPSFAGALALLLAVAWELGQAESTHHGPFQSLLQKARSVFAAALPCHGAR